MREMILLLAVCYGCIIQSALAGFTLAGYRIDFKDEGDEELKHIASSIANSKGQTAGRGWEIDKEKTTYFSSWNDNVESPVFKNYLEPEEIEKRLLTPGSALSNRIVIQRLPTNEIDCTIERKDFHDGSEDWIFITDSCGKKIIFYSLDDRTGL